MANNFKWSIDQQAAIDYTSSNLLISAGAGSGKTAVLTERIYQLVKKGADLSKFLILTFTKPASAEMKTRIREKILKDDETKHLSYLVDAAHIETFDAFALFIVKKYSSRLNVSPNIKILDETILKIQKRKILDEILTHLYEENNEDFLSLISTFCVKNDTAIRDFILTVSDVAEKNDDKYEFLSYFINLYFDKKKLLSYIDLKYELMIKQIDFTIKAASLLDDETDRQNIIDALETLKNNSSDFDSLLMNYSLFEFPRMGKSKTNEKGFRDAIKKDFNKGMLKYEDYGDKEEIVSTYLSNQKHASTIRNIVFQLEEMLDAFEALHESYSFADIAKLALKALNEEDIASEMKDYFDFILVDEYQDTSPIQEAVIKKLEKNNVCMVGDIKQSIYRFRNADCEIFQEKYEQYSKGDDGKVINLNTSYRSRKEIVDLVNEMFSQLMDKSSNPIDYKNGHIFGYGYDDYSSKAKEDYKLNVYKYIIDKNKPSYVMESEILADDIINKINNKFQIYDKNSKELRDCSFKDFAIIVDKGTKFETIKSILSDKGIPVKLVYDEKVTKSEVAFVLKNLLVLLNGALKDEYDDPKFVHAYVSIARSFLFQTKDADILNTVSNNEIKSSPIVKKINSFKEEIRYSPLSIMFKRLINEFDVYRKIISITHFASNTNKVELFINLSESMEEIGYTIDDLVQYFEDLNEYDLQIKYVDSDVSENSVTIITMHRSKGLEYPIVYLPLLDSNFNKSQPTSFLMSEVFGPLFPIVGITNKKSFFNHLYKYLESIYSFEEKLRLFYVAVTRAREKLIMIYGQKENGDDNISSLSFATSFKDLLFYLHFQNKYGLDYEFKNNRLTSNTDKDVEAQQITLKTVNVEPVECIKKKVSKDVDENIDESLLEFGTEIHYLLEIADYESKDLSYISDQRMRKYVSNVINSNVFKNVKNNELLHEFSFKDELNDTNGVIDCLVQKEDEIVIVDFKLKNLDDDKYVLQLHTYRDYIKQITKLPIKMYLVAAITGEVKEIE